MTSRIPRHVIHKSRALKPTVWIGKNGVSQEILNEIQKQLDGKNMVKIRILKSAIQEEQVRKIASRIAIQTEALLMDIRGHTFTLYKHER